MTRYNAVTVMEVQLNRIIDLLEELIPEKKEIVKEEIVKEVKTVVEPIVKAKVKSVGKKICKYCGEVHEKPIGYAQCAKKNKKK